jgi:hypothetical protein
MSLLRREKQTGQGSNFFMLQIAPASAFASGIRMTSNKVFGNLIHKTMTEYLINASPERVCG